MALESLIYFCGLLRQGTVPGYERESGGNKTVNPGRV